MGIDFNNLYKIRLSNKLDSSMDFHDIVKTLYARKILFKYRKDKQWIRLYTEFVIKDGKKCDLYFENIRTKECYIVEFQKNMNKKWSKDILDFYRDFNVSGLNTTDLIIVPLNKLSQDLNKLYKQLDEYIM